MAGTVKIESNSLVLEIHGVDVLLTMRKNITIPLSHVLSVSTEKVSWEPFKQLKIAGASLPGVGKDGMFLSKEGLLFFEMHNPEKCITISLDNEKYKKIIFEVQDKESAAKVIRDAISGNSVR